MGNQNKTNTTTNLLLSHTKMNMLDNYNIEKKLGEGASGQVYEASHLNSKKKCALKIVPLGDKNSAQTTLVKNEITVLQQLKHPNIVRLEDSNARVTVTLKGVLGYTEDAVVS